MLAVVVSAMVYAGDTHNRYVGTVDGFKGAITSSEDLLAIAKYTDMKTAMKLVDAFKDGVVTRDELKESGLQDHHFYTGYLAGAKTQKEYDDRLKQLNNGNNMDDYYVSNRDLKSHGSMVLNQVETRLEPIRGAVSMNAENIKRIEEYLRDSAMVDKPKPTPPIVTENKYDDTEIKEDIKDNSDKIEENKVSIDKNTSDISSNRFDIEENRRGIENNAKDISSLKSESRSGIAGVAAMTAIDFKGLSKNEVGIGAGLGVFKNKQAVAIGVGYMPTDNLTMNVKMALGDDYVLGTGMSYKFKLK